MSLSTANTYLRNSTVVTAEKKQQQRGNPGHQHKLILTQIIVFNFSNKDLPWPTFLIFCIYLAISFAFMSCYVL